MAKLRPWESYFTDCGELFALKIVNLTSPKIFKWEHQKVVALNLSPKMKDD